MPTNKENLEEGILLELEEDFDETVEVETDETILVFEATEEDDAEEDKEETSDEATDEDDADVTEVETKKERIVPKKETKDTDVKESVEAIFATGDELSEEFKEKATLVFEAALHARLAEEIEVIEEAAQAKLTEMMEAYAEKTETQINNYLDYVVNEWAEENRVGIEQGIQVDVMESLVTDIKAVFEAHNINLTTEEVPVLEQTQEELAKLEEKLNKVLAESIEKDQEILAFKKQAVFAEVAEGLADTQQEKLKTLAESVEASDIESYKEKVTVLKESFFKQSTVHGQKPSEAVMVDVSEGAEPEVKETSKSPMDAYLAHAKKAALEA